MSDQDPDQSVAKLDAGPRPSASMDGSVRRRRRDAAVQDAASVPTRDAHVASPAANAAQPDAGEAELDAGHEPRGDASTRSMDCQHVACVFLGAAQCVLANDLFGCTFTHCDTDNVCR